MGKAADRLFERACRKTAGFTAKDLKRLYTGFGFEIDDSGPHTLYYHPKYDLSATVTRASGEIANGYAQTARDLIKRLKEMEGTSTQ